MAFLEEEVMICLRSHAEIALDQGKVIDRTVLVSNLPEFINLPTHYFKSTKQCQAVTLGKVREKYK
jgi:hypothetical protein